MYKNGKLKVDERQCFSGQRVFRPGWVEWVEAELWFCKRKLRLSALGHFHVLGQDSLVFTGISFILAFHLLVAAAADALMIQNQNVALVQLLFWSCEF